MTVNEMKEVIDKLVEDGYGYTQVVIRAKRERRTLGPLPCSQVKSMLVGFDHNSGKVLINPFDELWLKDPQIGLPKPNQT